MESSGTSGAGGESSDSIVELNIKTLDSQIYSFKVDKNMPVLQFKEKIAGEIGLPAAQQRLIFRGKVLKDDHPLTEYHIESGHTLHLVARQPSESQPPSSTSHEGSIPSDGNRGNDPNAAGQRNRIGQISHSVVLGTLNLGDQGEGPVPDLSRVIGAVLNSIGIGQPTVQTPQSNTMDGTQNNGTQNNTGAQTQAGNQALPQVMQIPLGAQIPIPSLNAPIPDSLHTLSEFMNRMEQALSQNGYQPNQSANGSGDLPTVELPSNTRGLSTPDALAIVLRHAQRLLSGHTVAALSHIAGRLEQESNSTDPSIRSQIQTESMQVGLAMQHLGALWLELGRTILTLRMGQSPADSYVNSGPAVYISPTGPNPIMAQPFPLQTNSLFGGSAASPSTFGIQGPVGIGAVPRHVNIHIHAGQTRVQPARNPAATAAPSRPSGPVSSSSQAGPAENSAVQTPSAGVANDSDERNNPHMDQVKNEAGASVTGLSVQAVPSSSSVESSVENQHAAAAPLGLGLGGLQLRRPSRKQRAEGSTSDAAASHTQNQQTGQQVLQSLANRSSTSPPSAQIPPVGNLMDNLQVGAQAGDGQLDMANVMSQVLHNPAFDGLLSGVSEQTGAGSPNVLRNMMEQLTQSPAMMNTVNQIAQQLDGQDMGNMFAGLGRGQGGGIDLSSMVQQMMPLVSQALGGVASAPMRTASGISQQQFNTRNSRADQESSDRNSQAELQEVVEMIEEQSPPVEIFRLMVESAAHRMGNAIADLLNDLGGDEDLAIEFMEILCHDVGQRLMEEGGSAAE